MGCSDHDAAIGAAFTSQAASFAASPTMNAATVLDAIARLAGPARDEVWLDVACGPGIVTRRIATEAGSVLGLDLTPAMIELARSQASRERIANVRFELGDAAATGLPDDAVDGAVTRFSLHHIPVPARVIAELARVVRPGGRIVIADHAADGAGEARAFSQELERLRDPSHWASLSAERLRMLGRDAGLEPRGETMVPLALHFEDWLARGTDDVAAHALVERRLRDRPGGTDCFAVRGAPGERTLTLQILVLAWVVPG